MSFNTDSDWLITFDWSPAAFVVTPSVYYQVNGGPWIFASTEASVAGGFDYEIDPNDFAVGGEILLFKLVATDVVGCPDFSSSTAGGLVM